MICYFKPNVFNIRLRENIFFTFRGIARSPLFFVDMHDLMYSINGAICIRNFHWESGFLRESIGTTPLRHQRVENTLVT